MRVHPALPKSRLAAGLVIGTAVSALVTGGGFAIASIPSTATGDITSCVNKTTGAVRVIDHQAGKRCSSTERTVSWSKGFRFRGPWSSTTSYVVRDLVTYKGSTYLARLANRAATPGSSTSWILLAAKGATGLTGAAGPQGQAGPAGTNGMNGLDGAPGPVGPKGDQGETGTNGTDGNTILSGTTEPTTNDGVAGDFYLDLTTFTFYGPKSSGGGWTGTGNALKGPKGDTGEAGADGAPGAAGADGADGAQGPAGPVGPQGPAGTDGAPGPQGPAGAASPAVFTSSVSFTGLNAAGGPAYDSVGATAGCWGAVMGRSASCVNKYDSALMAGSHNVVKNVYVRAPGVTLANGESITVRVIVGSSPGNMGNAEHASYGLTCVLTQPASGQPNCQTAGPASAFPGLSGYFLGLEVTTTSGTPLTGTVYTSFELGNA